MNHNHTQHSAPDTFGAFSYPEENVSAKIIRVPNPYRFQAWCETCQDGLNSSSNMMVNAWADEHNAEKHRKETK